MTYKTFSLICQKIRKTIHDLNSLKALGVDMENMLEDLWTAFSYTFASIYGQEGRDYFFLYIVEEELSVDNVVIKTDQEFFNYLFYLQKTPFEPDEASAEDIMNSLRDYKNELHGDS